MIGDGLARSPSRVCGVCKREPALEEIGPRINGREIPLGPKCAGRLKAGDLVFVQFHPTLSISS